MDYFSTPPSQSCTYLGIYIDSKLSWRPHLTNLCLGVKKKTLWISNVIRRTCGLSSLQLKIPYNCLFVSSLTHCSYQSTTRSRRRRLYEPSLLISAFSYHHHTSSVLFLCCKSSATPRTSTFSHTAKSKPLLLWQAAPIGIKNGWGQTEAKSHTLCFLLSYLPVLCLL